MITTSPGSCQARVSGAANLGAALDGVVAVHCEAFPGFFMTQLGRPFLREYYRCVVESPLGILITESSDGECVAFVAGFVDPAAFYRSLRRRRLRLGLAASLGVVTRPWRLATLLANARRARVAAEGPGGREVAELSSLAVRPAGAGCGAGSRLIKAFADAARAAGADRVVLTTDASGNDEVNKFYRSRGFTCVRTLEARRGRWLNEYVLDIRKV